MLLLMHVITASSDVINVSLLQRLEMIMKRVKSDTPLSSPASSPALAETKVSNYNILSPFNEISRMLIG